MATPTAQWPEWMRPGVRVFRGPDWKATIRDATVVELGTLSYVPKQAADNSVNVVWDNGIERSYNSGFKGQYLLRAYDTSQVGIVHQNTKCAGCNVSPIRGMMFRCLTCSKITSLCMACYMDDKHDLDHSFSRYDSNSKSGTSGTHTVVPARKGSKKMKVTGVFKDAEVIRGPHWRYKNDDGGDTCKGTVLSFVDVKDDIGNGWVRVKWEINKHVAEYRLGAGGYVDIVAFKTICGRKAYIDHLPVVGIITLKNGDKVTVNMSLNEFKALQKDPAYKVPNGWNDGMKQCLNEIGTVMELMYDETVVRVQYENGNSHLVARMALYRKGGFQKNGVVRIVNSSKVIKKLQDGHGGYNKKMDSIQGQLGRILRIKPDGDMVVLVDNEQFNLSPVCCHPEEDPAEIKKAPVKPTGTSKGAREKDTGAGASSSNSDEEGVDQTQNILDFENTIAHAFSSMMKSSSSEEDGPAMFDALTKGDLDTVRRLITHNKDLLNFKADGRTILHMTCHEGYASLMEFLLDLGADTSVKDEEGDTALHYAAFGKQPDCVQKLLENEADPDVQNNRGLTPLIVAINHPCVDSVQCLILHECDVNLKDRSGNTAMHDAVEKTVSQPILVETVLGSPGAKFNIKNDKGFNVLNWAVIKNNQSGVALVLQKNKRLVEEKLDGGFSALHVAAANDFIEITSKLLEDGGADPNSLTDDKMTPLHVAVTQANKRVIEVLVDKGADVNAADKDGNTALHLVQQSKLPLSASASRRSVSQRNEGNIQILYYLLEKGADINKPNNKNVTPLDLVNDPKQKEMIKRLISAYKTAPAKSQGGVRLPIHWEEMQVTETKYVTLDTSNAAQNGEFQEIKRHFDQTMSQCNVLRIRRVQNALLWEHYTLKKRLMESKLGQGCANELHLYHGTKPDLVDVIAQENFDFRIAGSRVGALYGDGSYFATTAKYSDLYAVADDSTGTKFMFVGKVLVGKIALGSPGLKRPPPIDAKDLKKGLYDSTVNNVMSPTIYCVFDTNQYYPEYVIEYN